MSSLQSDMLKFGKNKLLKPTELSPFVGKYTDSVNPFFLFCDHAGFTIPEQLDSLGLQEQDRYRHIAWDIGIKGVGEKLSDLLQATLVTQTYSRLVIDCNRSIHNPTLITPVSDQLIIPGNQNLSENEKQARIDEIYTPYHQFISELLDKRQGHQLQTMMISLHSFTPEMQTGEKRPWHAGILHSRQDEFALIFKQQLEQHYPYPIGDNEPYALTEKNDYSIPFHALQRNLPYLELEIRQDLITTETQQQEWAERLALLLPLALKEYETKWL